MFLPTLGELYLERCMFGHYRGDIPIEWYWKVWFRDYVYFGMAIVLALLSIVIVWSESTFGIPIGDDKHLSIAANLVYHGHMNNNYAIVEVR